MAYITEKTYTQTVTGNRDFAVTFPFLETSDLRVQLGGVTKTLTVDYTIVQSGANTVINFNTAPADSSTIRIFRDTDIDAIKATYAAGNSIRASDLNENNTQLLYAAQEFGTLKEDNSVSFTLGDKGDIQVNSSSDWVIQNNSIEQAHLLDNSVGTNEIIDASVTGGKLANLAITSAQLATDAVINSKIDDNAVTTSKIADVQVTTAKLANEAVEPTKIKQTAAAGSGFTPAGAVIWYAGSTAPTGYLKANGDQIPNGSGTVQGVSADFSGLYAIVGANLPDLRGEFIRALDDSRGVDSNRNIRSTQDDLIENHVHPATTGTDGAHTHTTTQGNGGGHTHVLNTGAGKTHHSQLELTNGGFGSLQNIKYAANSGATSTTGIVFSDNLFKGSSSWASSAYTDTDSGFGVPDGTHDHALVVNNTNSAHTHTIAVSNNTGGGNETRPRNVALLACIKY